MSKLIDGGLIETACLRALSQVECSTAYMVEQAIHKATGLSPANRTIRLALNRMLKIGEVKITPESAKRRIKLFAITAHGKETLAENSYYLNNLSTYIIKKATGEQA